MGRIVIPRGEDGLQENDEVFFMCATSEVNEVLRGLNIVLHHPERVVFGRRQSDWTLFGT